MTVNSAIDYSHVIVRFRNLYLVRKITKCEKKIKKKNYVTLLLDDLQYC